MRARDHKKKLGCLSIILILAILFFALPTRKLVFKKHYDVVSIATLAEYHDKARMDRASASVTGTASYPSPIVFQSNPSICGPTSLLNVFRSFGEANTNIDGVLAGTGKCGSGACFMGLTLDELGEVAGHHPGGYRVTVLRDLSLAAFRDHLGHISDPKRRYVLNFDRGPLFGTEGGHHSPIGGYLADEDLVLVLDVNAKFEPWLAKAERVYTAMDTLDSGKKRGLVMIEKD